MADFNNIVGGLNIPTQIPLDVKTVSLTESALSSLGIDNNKAFTYYDGLKIFCLDTRKTYEWREVGVGEANTGLVTLDFTYPNNTITFGVDYSNKIFNFFEIPYALSSDIKDIVSPNNTVNITETSTQIQLTVTPPNGSETKIINGLQTTVTGTGTTLDPYKIDGKLYQAGNGITITGLGTSVSPYIVSINNTSGNIGWLPGDTKEVVCTNEYLTLNFDGTGLGINERIGWAIMNGNNGTPNDNGRVVVAYGTNYPTLEEIGGQEDAIIPEHDHESIVFSGGLKAVNDTGTGTSLINQPELSTPYGTGFVNKTSITGVSATKKNMQPYVVRLRIMKI